MLNEKSILPIQDSYSVQVQEAKPFLFADNWTVVDLSNYAQDRFGQTIVDDDGKPVCISAEFDLKACYEGMPTEYELSVKLDLLSQYSHSNGHIEAKPSTFKTKIHQYKIIRSGMQKAGLRYFKQINYQTLGSLCIEMLKPLSDPSALNPNGYKYGIISHNSLIKTLSTLGNMYVNSALHGLLDYPSIQVIPEECLGLIERAVSEHIEYKVWLESGTHGTLPLEVSMVILNEALEYFEAPELKRILALVQAVSKFSYADESLTIGIITSSLRRFIVGEYGRDDTGVFNLVPRYIAGSNRSFKLRKSNNVTRLAAIYFELCDEFKVNYQFENRLQSIEDLALRVRHSFYRVSASLSVLTGVRWTELASLKTDAFEFSSYRGKFKSKIKKTQNNTETYRPITIHAEPIAWIANGLSQQSAFHGEETVSPWLLKAILPWQKQTTAINGLSWKDNGSNSSMGGFYRELLSGLISDYDSQEHAISSHRFRHTWAELAIRRFDGNVPEAIRNYFRHCYGSFMTMDYIKGKIKADLPEINREYMREIVHRIAEGEDEFYGPAAKYILSIVKDVDVLEPKHIDEILDEFEMVKVYEHSYCMMPKKFKTQAKCWDKLTQTPNYDDARWDNCGGCIGRCTLGNEGSAHKDAILRVGMTAQEMIKTNESLGLNNLNDFWQKQLKKAESALKEMETKFEIADVTEIGDV